MTPLAAGKFKDLCLKILDEVAETRRPVTVTKRGKPVAMVVPCPTPAKSRKGLKGSVLEEHGSLFRTGESWDADRS